MKFGISTSCFYPELTETAVSQLAQAGIPVVEVFFNAPSELEEGYLSRLKATLDAGGSEVLSIHPFSSGLEPLLFFSQYQRRYNDSLTLYRQYFEAGARLGAKYFVLHGDRRESDLPEEVYFERFAGLDAAACEYGLRVAQENVARCRSGSLGFLKRMKEALPDAAFVLDLKQARRSGEDWREILAALGRNVRHLHLSGCSGTEDCLPPIRGDFDCGELLRLLRQAGFDGGVILELYRDNYRDFRELADSWKKMENLAAVIL